MMAQSGESGELREIWKHEKKADNDPTKKETTCEGEARAARESADNPVSEAVYDESKAPVG